MRPSINIPRKSVIDLNGFFGLHPSLSAFQPLWQQGHLAIVHAAGSPDTTRSHFDAQDFMETGTPGVKVTEDGWLNRSLHSMPRGGAELALSRDCAGAVGAAHPERLRAGRRDEQHQRLFGRRKESQSVARCDRV